MQYITQNGSYGYWVTSIGNLANGPSGSTAGWMYTLNDVAPSTGAAVTTVANGDNVIWYYNESMSQAAPTWTQVISAGTGNFDPIYGGTVGLNNVVNISIPAGALGSGTTGVQVNINAVSSPPSPPTGVTLLGAYDFTVGGAEYYTFSSPVTLTFTFNPSSVQAGTTPAVYYYDSTTSLWVLVTGGVVNSTNDTITVTISHFTTYALMATATSGSGGTSGASVGVAVVGANGQIMFGPSTVVISSSGKWGQTALGALDATGLQYVAQNGSYGIWVTYIGNFANGPSGSTVGWMYTLNDASPSVGPLMTTVANGDHVILVLYREHEPGGADLGSVDVRGINE